MPSSPLLTHITSFTLNDASFSQQPSSQQKYIKYDDCIGVGAFKHVYRCINVMTGIECAWNEVSLDKMDPVTCSKIFQEIEFYKFLKNDNILQIFDSWFNESNTLIFITEYVVGGSLRDYLKRIHFGVKLSIIQNWTKQIISALDYLHQNGIIHRDIKAQNIYIDYVTGNVKIGDMGLATFGKFRKSANVGSKQMSITGTSEFIAPEVYLQDYDDRVDIYALGMTLIELATKEYPYQECQHTMQIYQNVTNGIPPEALKKVTNPILLDLIQQCIKTKPEERITLNNILHHPFFTTDLSKETTLSPAISMKIKHSTAFLPVINGGSPFPAQPQSPPPPSAQLKQASSKPKPFLTISVNDQQKPAFPTQQCQTTKAQSTAPQVFQQPLLTDTSQQKPIVTFGPMRINDGKRIVEVLIQTGTESFKWPICENDDIKSNIQLMYSINNVPDQKARELINLQIEKIFEQLKQGTLGEQGSGKSNA